MTRVNGHGFVLDLVEVYGKASPSFERGGGGVIYYLDYTAAIATEPTNNLLWFPLFSRHVRPQN